MKWIKRSLLLSALALFSPAFSAPVQAVNVDVYQNMTNGNDSDFLTEAIMDASSHGGVDADATWSWSIYSTTKLFWVSDSFVRQLPGTVTVNGINYTGASAHTWKFYDKNETNYVSTRFGNVPRTYPISPYHDRITLACYYTPGNTGRFDNNWDTIIIGGGNMMGNPAKPVYAVMQTIGNAGPNPPYIRAHTDYGTSTGIIKVVPGKTYWVNLHYDGVAGKCYVAAFDPDNGFAQVGNTVEVYAWPGSQIGNEAKFGRADKHANNTEWPYDTYAYFSHIMIDYTEAKFPLLPDISSDTTAPVISSIQAVGVSSSGATITWNTDEAANSRVEYGLTAFYGQFTNLDASLVTSHSRVLSGLTAGTVYHYRVHSLDSSGNAAASADQIFTTLALSTSTYWVSPTGTATWVNAKSAVPLNGAAACSLATANTNAQAGDTVYLRGGTYLNGTTSVYNINPSKSGTASARITFSNYNNETVTISGGDTTGVSIKNKSYITVRGINFSSIKYFMSIFNSHYNIVEYCTFDKSLFISQNTWAGAEICNNSQYNWVHYCTFSRFGGYNGSTHSSDMLIVGYWSYDPIDDTSYNLIENNDFFYGGHSNLTVGGNHNVIRDNYLHNEAWQLSGGYIDAITYGPTAYLNLFERNIFSFSGEGGGITLRTGKDIFRSNLFYNNYGGGITINTELPGVYHLFPAEYNHIYNNVFFKNGWGAVNTNDMGGINFHGVSTTPPYGAAYNVIKNNIFHLNKGLVAAYDWGWKAPNTIDNNWAEQGDPLFVYSGDGSDLDPFGVKPDFHLKTASPCINAGTFLTTITSPAGSGTQFTVADALYFMDGWGIPNVQGDEIQLFGTTQRARITAVDYNTNTITVDRALTWTQNQGISLAYEGSAPDLGAYEYAPDLSLTSPSGGETWVRGFSHDITWSSSGVTEPVKIELFKDSALQWNVTVPVADGSYAWPIPNGQTPGNDYTIKISAGSYLDTSDPFTIAASAAPMVQTLAAQSVTTSSASLRGTVHPMGLATTYYFEYGPTNTYGSETAEITLAAGDAITTVPALIAGLKASTLYHFRLTATNSAGTTNGNDMTFTTSGGGGGSGSGDSSGGGGGGGGCFIATSGHGPALLPILLPLFLFFLGIGLVGWWLEKRSFSIRPDGAGNLDLPGSGFYTTKPTKEKPIKTKSLFAITFLLLLLLGAPAGAETYYVSPSGADSNNGLSTGAAWQTISKVNGINFSAGDRILFEGGSTFVGSLSFDSSDTGTEGNPIIISSYGSGRAVVNAGTLNGFYAYNTGGIELKKITFIGDGSYQAGQRGIYFYTDLTSGQRLKHIYIDECEVSGFSSGIIISAYKSSTIGFEDIKITNCSSHDNLFTGIGVSGGVISNGYRAHKDLYIADCVAFNISGGTLNTGNGISVADCENGIMEYCEAYNNGYGNTGTNGGPEGIIAYRTDSITIQYCISHNNKTGPNNWDGGGFDLDGGTSNCILQYNYAYENVGQGFFMGHFSGASPKANNIVRYNISENNGLRHGYGGIGFFGQSGNIETGLKIYNNVIYTSLSKVNDGSPSCVRLENAAATTYTDIVLYNNIFIAADGLNLINISSQTNKFTFKNNLYYSSGGAFKITWGGTTYNSLAAWRTATGQERLNSSDVGIQADPRLINPGNGEKTLTPRTLAALLNAYKTQSNSPGKDSGLDINALFGINAGSNDFYGNAIPQNRLYDIGAHEYISSGMYTVRFSAGSGGTLSGDADQTVTQGGSTSAVTAVPNSGYRFDRWSGDVSGTTNPLTISDVQYDMSITAQFAVSNNPQPQPDGGGGGGGGGGCFIAAVRSAAPWLMVLGAIAAGLGWKIRKAKSAEKI